MSHVIEVQQNPDGSWTARGGSSVTIVSVTCLTRHKAVTRLDAALSAISRQANVQACQQPQAHPARCGCEQVTP